MEPRKEKEIEYYDRGAKRLLKGFSEKKEDVDFEGFSPFLLESYIFLRNLLKNKCKDKKILDYGCGNGIHAVWLAKYGAKVVGIDLSEKSLVVARERAKREKVGERVKFLKMDCEKMEFPDNSFDIIFDGGTFSSIDLKRALPELARALKPEGFLIGIETLGHNPILNLKRKINQFRGKRTKWATEHIFRMEDLNRVEQYFETIETYFFHLISWVAFPFLDLPGGKTLLRLLETIERPLLSLPFLRKYAFKTVFLFSLPKKK